jgi:hypothetical protein
MGRIALDQTLSALRTEDGVSLLGTFGLLC